MIFNEEMVCRWQWQCHWRAGHYGSHPRPQVADRGTPSKMDKRVAPDKEGAADKQWAVLDFAMGRFGCMMGHFGQCNGPFWTIFFRN